MSDMGGGKHLTSEPRRRHKGHHLHLIRFIHDFDQV